MTQRFPNEALLPDRIRKYISSHNLEETLCDVINSCLDVEPDNPWDHIVQAVAIKGAAEPKFVEVRPARFYKDKMEIVVNQRGREVCTLII